MRVGFRTKLKMVSFLIMVGVGYIILNLEKNLPSTGKIREDKDDKEIMTLSQEDPKLIQYIRNHHLFPPSDKPYNLTKNQQLVPGQQPNEFQQFVRHLLRNMTNGFFIEGGANDGEISNTLYLERHDNWTGVLIEPQRKVLSILRAKNRKAWIVDTALSPTTHFETLPFNHIDYDQASGLDQQLSPKTRKRFLNTQNVSDVPCLPIFSILLALNVSVVDYFCLDVEGAELNILRTIPFDKVFIKIFSIEVQFLNTSLLTEFMLSKNYAVARKNVINDYIYVHNAVDFNKDPFVRLPETVS